MSHRNMGHMIAAAVVLGLGAAALGGSFAAGVVSYEPGSTPAAKWPAWDPYTQASAALGAPDGVTEGFSGPNILSVFNPAAELDEIVSIGEGGHLTLALANLLVTGEGPELGIFSHVGLAEADWNNPNGTVGDPVTAFGVDTVTIEVSPDALLWASLGSVLIDRPTNAWTDAASPYLTDGAGLTPANYSKPFTAPQSAFAGQTWPQILTLLDGSGGGAWLDLEAAGMPIVAYVRFSVPDDGDPNTAINFELDAVSIAEGHIGDIAPEPVSAALLLAGGLACLRRRRL